MHYMTVLPQGCFNGISITKENKWNLEKKSRLRWYFGLSLAYGSYFIYFYGQQTAKEEKSIVVKNFCITLQQRN